MAPINIIVKGVDEKIASVQIDSNALVKALIDKISKSTAINGADVEMDSIRILYAGKQLEYSSGQTLSDYDIVNNSTIFVVLRLNGGWNPIDAARLKKQTLQALPGHVTITNELDMISLDDDPDVRRAKMSCGHVIGVESMTSYARSVVDQGYISFFCPHIDGSKKPCNREWPYFVVRHVAAMSSDEMKEFDTKLSENFLNKAAGIQRCPRCKTYCMRKRKSDIRVICPICTHKAGGKTYEFCWACSNRWYGSDQRNCGNENCDGTDERVKYLATCERKEIGGVKNVPKYRSCPKCGILIEHATACKHMDCRACKQSFCFVCLKLKNQDNSWPCGSSSARCEVAPPQTVLPGN